MVFAPEKILGRLTKLLDRACDLTKDQRDEHIRRFAELIELQSTHSAAIESKREDGRGPGQPKGIARWIADETGLNRLTAACG